MYDNGSYQGRHDRQDSTQMGGWAFAIRDNEGTTSLEDQE